MVQVYSFPPIVGKQPHILILGSMPGKPSLTANEYYAHPRNQFWSIMEELIVAQGEYEERTQKLIQERIALWDVLKSCVREGSLDKDIQKDTEIPNDFVEFFAIHPKISHIFFNGQPAEKIFRRHFPQIRKSSKFHFYILPSTSPRHMMTQSIKLAAWRKLLEVK